MNQYSTNLIRQFVALIISAFFLSSCFSIASQAYENFNECELFEKLLIAKSGKLSLDEAPYVSHEYSGLEFFVFNKDENGPLEVYIDKIHPDLYATETLEETDKYKIESLWEIENGAISKINGKKIEELDEAEFYKEAEKSEIEITVQGIERTFYFQNKTFLSMPVIFTINVDHISEINSKKSSAKFNLKSNLVWNDYRISEIGHEVRKKAQLVTTEAKDGGFSCLISAEVLKSIRYPTPAISINDFTADQNQINQSKIKLNYFTPESCDEDCTVTEKKYGEIYFSRNQTWQGQVLQEFDLKKFPFDTQELKLFVTSEQPMGITGGHYDLIISELLDANLDENMINAKSQEWNFFDYSSGYAHYYDPDEDVRVAGIESVLNIERASNYYIFKVIFPITLILLICWSVFWVNPEELESRLTLSVVSLLTLIAYNFVVDQDLPKLGYLTFLDEFILYSYLFAGIPTLQTVLCKALVERKRPQLAVRLDKDFRIYHPLSYLFMLGFLAWDYGII